MKDGMTNLLGEYQPQLRRKARAKAPSALVGLVAFSFTLLVFGSATYMVSLPGLASNAPQLLMGLPEGLQWSEGGSTSLGLPLVATADQLAAGEVADPLAAAASGGSRLPGISIGGASGSGLPSTGAGSALPGATGGNDGDKNSDKDAATDKPSSGDGSNDKGDADDPAPTPDPEPTPEPEPDPEPTPGYDAVLDQQFRASLNGFYQDFPSWYSAAVSLSNTFYQNWESASPADMQRYQAQADSLFNEILNQRINCVNVPSQLRQDGTQYGHIHDSLIEAYNALLPIAENVSVAWQDLIAGEDWHDWVGYPSGESSWDYWITEADARYRSIVMP